MTMADWSVVAGLATSGLSAAAAVLAWLAKLRWSQEFAAAKDETIRAKDAQIAAHRDQLENLRELLSPKVREYVTAQKEMLEAYIESLKSDVTRGKDVVAEMERTIEALTASEAERAEEARRLVRERDEVSRRVAVLEKHLRVQQDSVDTDWIQTTENSSEDLKRHLIWGSTIPSVSELRARWKAASEIEWPFPRSSEQDPDKGK